MEWPGQDPADAVTSTLNAITDFYRIKLAGGTKGARATIATIGNAITAAKNGKAIRSKAANVLKGRTEAYPSSPATPSPTGRQPGHGYTAPTSSRKSSPRPLAAGSITPPENEGNRDE
jgi:hypothetical protein